MILHIHTHEHVDKNMHTYKYEHWYTQTWMYLHTHMHTRLYGVLLTVNGHGKCSARSVPSFPSFRSRWTWKPSQGPTCTLAHFSSVSLGLVALHAVPMLVWLNTDRATSWSVSPWGWLPFMQYQCWSGWTQIVPHHGVCLPEVGCPSCSTNVGLAEHRSCHIMECVSLRLVALHAVPMLVWLNTDRATSWSVSPWGCPSCSTNVGLAEHRSCHIMECVSLGLPFMQYQCWSGWTQIMPHHGVCLPGIALHAVPMLVWLNTDRAKPWSVSPWGWLPFMQYQCWSGWTQFMPKNGVCLPEVGCPSCSTNVGLAEHSSCQKMECGSLAASSLHPSFLQMISGVTLCSQPTQNSGSSQTSDLKTGTPMATLQGATNKIKQTVLLLTHRITGCFFWNQKLKWCSLYSVTVFVFKLDVIQASATESSNKFHVSVHKPKLL